MIYIKLFTVYVNSLLRFPKVSIEAFQVQGGLIRQSIGLFTPFSIFSYFIYLGWHVSFYDKSCFSGEKRKEERIEGRWIEKEGRKEGKKTSFLYTDSTC